jgi:iron complex outermembrane receptor protein
VRRVLCVFIRKGLEIAANVIPVRTDDLEWSIGGNVTFQDSKITKLTTTLPNTQV